MAKKLMPINDKKYQLSIKQRSSSPKIQVLNTALMSAPSHLTLETAQKDREYWGRLVESAVGAHLMNSAREKNFEVYYWLDRNHEVDFVLRGRGQLAAIEVKTGRRRERLAGMDAFSKAFKVNHPLLVGSSGIPVKEFLESPVEHWLG